MSWPTVLLLLTATLTGSCMTAEARVRPSVTLLPETHHPLPTSPRAGMCTAHKTPADIAAEAEAERIKMIRELGTPVERAVLDYELAKKAKEQMPKDTTVAMNVAPCDHPSNY